jgi:ABC-type sugar transport system permease subunit
LFAINAFLSLKVSRRSGFGFSSSSASPRFLRRLACVAMYHTARVLLAEVVVVVVGATVVVVVTAAAALVVVAATYHTCEGRNDQCQWKEKRRESMATWVEGKEWQESSRRTWRVALLVVVVVFVVVVVVVVVVVGLAVVFAGAA